MLYHAYDVLCIQMRILRNLLCTVAKQMGILRVNIKVSYIPICCVVLVDDIFERTCSFQRQKDLKFCNIFLK